MVGENADLRPPLPGEVARRNAETERLLQICDDLSVTFGDSVPTPFVPSGHFPLIGGIGPWEGSLSPQEGNIYPDFIRTFY